MRRTAWLVIVALAGVGGACAASDVVREAERRPAAPTTDETPTIQATASGITPSTSREPTVPTRPTTAVAVATPTPVSTVPPVATLAPVSTVAPVVEPASASEMTSQVSVPLVVTTTPYLVPLAQPQLAGWSPDHAAYRATDIFVAGGCGAVVVSPVNGVVLEARRVDEWTAAIDNPATRGGRSVTIRGDDGVRYYLAHFASIETAIEVGAVVRAGTPLGTVGDSGRTSACHIHFGISPPCPEPEWSVRRGAIWPYPYLDAWNDGRQLSPADEIATWVAANPDACAIASADPFAHDG